MLALHDNNLLQWYVIPILHCRRSYSQKLFQLSNKALMLVQKGLVTCLWNGDKLSMTNQLGQLLHV